MVFKLIRVDVDKSSKIQLRVGKHTIGRGKFLHNDDTDKRVSRNHAELEVTDDTVTLKSLHQNPCFYIKNKTVDTEILQQNSTISLSNGDKFGLIPDNFWYEVIYCSDSDIKDDDECVNNNSTGDNDTDVKRKEFENQNNETNLESQDDQVINFHMSEEENNLNRSASPSLLTAGDEESTQGYVHEADPNLSTPTKRSQSSRDTSPVDIKRVKTEATTPNTQDVQPGPSNDQGASDSDSKDIKPAPASPAKPAPLRERCMYGANCYRRNPQHKAQFSHPADSDWGAGDRGVCPYGHACRKADPRHWQSHEHPPGVNPPAPNIRPGMQVVHRHGNVYYINAHSVNFYDDHFQVEDSDGDSVDYDYEF